MAINDLITFRKGTASQWSDVNPVLASGEPGYDLTNSTLKIGDGVSNWVALSGIGSTNIGVRGIISTTGNLSSFAVSGGYQIGYLDLFQDGVKLVLGSDFVASDGSAVSLTNSVPSGTTLEYLTIVQTVAAEDARWAYFYPPAPTGLVGTPGSTLAELSWSAGSGNIGPSITDYSIQYSSNSGSSWTTFSDGTSTATTTSVTGLSNGSSYLFRVAAINGIGTGSYSSNSSSVTPIAGDPYFSYVSLLLHADGTNTTFVDSSNIPKAVTAFGSATQSAAQSKWGGKSLSLNGTSDYLTVPSSSAFDLPADFTIEAWINLSGYSDSFSGYYGAAIASRYSGVGGNTGWQLRINGTSSSWTTINLYTGSTDLNWSYTFSNNVWYHVAVVRSGGTITVYVDGTAIGAPATNSDNLTPSNSNDLYIGSLQVSGYRFFLPGYIDDLRITKAARIITLPTAAFPNVVADGQDQYFAQVSLLLHGDGNLTDSSITPKTVTAVGGAAATGVAKFGSFSISCDGDGDGLTLSDGLPRGSENFSVEFWAYKTTAWSGDGNNRILYEWADNSLSGGVSCYLNVSINSIRVGRYGQGDWYMDYPVSGLSAATWYHVAVVRDGNTMALWIDGVSVLTSTFSGDFGSTSGLQSIGIGSYMGSYSAATSWPGRIDDFRVTRGVARTITLPTAAFLDS